ncbi:MAG: hypothetical protein COA32_01425 [Fluviicola sp.]|nr:MAG: hypothetical protein COA32_01425 [Fluviicola sp.]
MNSTKICNIKYLLNYFGALSLFVFLFFACSPTIFSQTSLVFPNDNWVQIDDSLSFTWNECSNVDSYEISFSNSSQFTVEDIFNVVENNYEDDFSYGKYFWRVRCIVSGSPGPWSSTRSFAITDLNNFGNIAFWIAADSNVVKDVNDKVSEWNDIGINNIDFIQPVLNPQPLWEDSIEKLNNQSAMNFDGVDDFLEASISNLNIAELFVVANWKGTQTAFPGFNGLIMPNSGLLFYVGQSSTTNFFSDASTAFIGNNFINRQSTINFGPINKFKLVHGRRSSPANYSGTGFRVGRDRNLANRFWNGYIPEIVSYSTPLNAANLDSVHQYLRFKYAPPVNLGLDFSKYSFCDTTLSAGTRFESYLWSTSETTETISISESGTYWVEVVDIFGFASSDTIEVDFPEAFVPQFPVYCGGGSYTWNANLGADYNYLWSTSETTESIVINTEDNFSVTITDSFGCAYNSPVVSFTEDTMQATISLGPDVQLCAGNQIGLVNTVPDIVNYNWSTTETTPSIVVNSTDEYILEVTNAAGCVAKDTINVDIIGVAPDMDIEFPLIQCVGASNDYNDLSVTLDGSSINSWEWSFGDGSISTDESGTHTYISSGTYEVILEVDTDGDCGNTITKIVEVQENPVLDFSTSGICQEQQISFNGGQLTPTTINTWQWNFDDPASGVNNEGSGQNTTHIFETSGVYDIELIGTDNNGCVDTTVQSITIEPTPQVDFSFLEVCEGNLVDFENLSTIESPGTINGYNWSFGDGTFSGQTEPQKLYSNYGTYSVNLSATGNNGCSGQLTVPLKIHAFPIVNQDVSSSCAGITSVFDDASFVPNGSVAEVYWSLNGASSLNAFSIEHIFEDNGSQTIDQTVVSSFGCSSNESYAIQVDDFIQADFEIDPGALLAGYTTSFNNLSVGATSNEWTFDVLGTSNDVSPDFIFPESSVGDQVTIELKIENSFLCRDSVSITLPVLSPRTDLALTQLFLQEDNGFYVVGVELENKGTTPITSAELFLRTPSADVLKETWEGELQAGDKEIYIFSASPSMTVPQDQIDNNYVCVEGQIKTPFEFDDEDLSNNEKCNAISEFSGVLIVPHPNPVDNELNIQLVLPFDEVGTLEIYNAQGQIVAVVKENENFVKGLNSYKVNTELWQSGNYSIVYNGEEKQQIAKVIKL